MTRPRWTRTVTLAATAALIGCGTASDATPEGETSAAATLELADLRGRLEIAHDKFNQLAEAMPEGTYARAPMEGVRSVGDVYQHIAADNYYVPALMGFEPPAETGVTYDNATFRAFQEQSLSRSEILRHLDASFDFMLESMDASADELDRALDLRGNQITVGDLWIRAITHLHEHLGQSIAYARSHEVVPPWSR